MPLNFSFFPPLTLKGTLGLSGPWSWQHLRWNLSYPQSWFLSLQVWSGAKPLILLERETGRWGEGEICHSCIHIPTEEVVAWGNPVSLCDQQAHQEVILGRPPNQQLGAQMFFPGYTWEVRQAGPKNSSRFWQGAFWVGTQCSLRWKSGLSHSL